MLPLPLLPAWGLPCVDGDGRIKALLLLAHHGSLVGEGDSDALRLEAPLYLASQLDLDPIRIMDGAKVALLRASMPYLPRYLDTLDHEPNHGPTPL